MRMAYFDSVRFYLSSSLSEDRRAELKHVLLKYGGREAKSISGATHVITDTNKFEGCQDVGRGTDVVTDLWIERSIILEKAQSPSHYSADPAMIFSGVVACATELSATDVEVLAAGITALGGQWRTALTRDVTHLFCVSNSSPKYTTAMHFKEQTEVHVILPHWFDDSVRLGARGLPMATYEWPDPPLLMGPEALAEAMNREKDGEKDCTGKRVLFSTLLVTPGEPLPADIPGLTLSDPTNIWNGRRILLSPSLDFTTSRRLAVEAGIARAGGIVVPYVTNSGDPTNAEEAENVGKCDVLVTRWRSGRAYVKAVRENKTIGTLGWLFYVHASGAVSRPMDQLLHYPIPRRPIDGFSSHEITVTNYTGEAREYLKKLIAAMGATFTPSMSGKNTVLIAAYLSGTKTAKAAAWSIPIVNHTWLEDCFIKWRNLTVGVEKYIIFPPGIDFSKILGERGVGGGFTVAGVTNGEVGIGVGGWVGLESEEELQILEREDDPYDAEMAAVDDEGSVGGEVDRPLVIGQSSSPSRRATNGKERPRQLFPIQNDIRLPPSSPTTQASTDTREVEAAITIVQDDDLGTPVPLPKGKQKINRKGKEQAKKTAFRKMANGHMANGSDDDVEVIEVERVINPAKGKKVEWPKAEGKRAVAIAVEIPKSPFRGKKISKNNEDEGGLRSSRSPANGKSRRTVITDDEEASQNGESGVEGAGQTNHHRQSQKVAGRTKERAKTAVEGEPDREDDIKAAKAAEKRRRAASEPRKKVNAKAKVRGNRRVAGREESEEGDEEQPFGSSIKAKSGHSPGNKAGAGIPSKTVKWRKRTAEVEEENGYKEKENERGRPSQRTGSKKPGKARKSPSPLSSDENEEEDNTPKRKSLRLYRGSSPLSPPPTSPPASGRSSKRNAAMKASQRLHDEIMPDMNSYQNALRKGRISLGAAEGRLKPAWRSSPITAGRKRKAEKPDDEGESEDREPEPRKKRRVSFDVATIRVADDARGTRSTESSARVLVTMTLLSDDVTKALTKLGVMFTTNAKNCTHMIAPRIGRTEKFLCALANAPFVLSEEWAIKSAAARKLLPEKKYLLQDSAGEEKFSFRLKDAIERAKQGKIFANKAFYVTPKVSVNMQLLKNVITSCGGQFFNTTPTVRILNASPNRHVISCPEDAPIWRPISAHFPIYSQELILSGALKQMTEWDNDSYRVQGSF